MEEFRIKLRETAPIANLEQLLGKHPYKQKEPSESWPDYTYTNT